MSSCVTRVPRSGVPCPAKRGLDGHVRDVQAEPSSCDASTQFTISDFGNQQVAQLGRDLLHRRPRDDLLHGGEILEDDDGLRAGVVQLVLQLRGVYSGLQFTAMPALRSQRHGILEQVELMIATRSPFGPPRHKPCREIARQPVERGEVSSCVMLVNAGSEANFLQLSPGSCGTLAYQPVSLQLVRPQGMTTRRARRACARSDRCHARSVT